MKPLKFKSGRKVSGHGVTEKVKPVEDLPTLVPKKKTTSEKTGINIVPN